MGILWSLAKSSSKIMATFVVLIVLTLLLIFFFPGSYKGLQNLSNGIDQAVRNPPFGDLEIVFYRFLVNGTTILSVIMTLIARAIVEVGTWAGGTIWKGLNAESKVDSAESAAGIKDQGYYEA